MLNRCENCGGDLRYDIPSGQLKCGFCDSAFDPEGFESRTDAEENTGGDQEADLEITLYTCPTCGAQVSAERNAAVDYCLYCGSFVTLKKQMSKMRKPDYIVPFTKTQEECRALYKKMIRRKLYAPKEFHDEKFLEGFKGIYIPYWTYGYSVGAEIKLPGETEERKGSYIHKQRYEISCKVEHADKEVSFDASSSFDDQISSRIVPFGRDKKKDFSPAYMFGFFGDTADVSGDVYEKEALEVARDKVWDELSDMKEIQKGHPKRPKDATLDKMLKMGKSRDLTMVPVWFLTWKKGDRVAYSVVNGENGKIYSEVPVSIWRYLIISALTAIPIFLLMNSLWTFNASNMLLISVVLSGISMILYGLELERIVRRNLHADDSGYLSIYNKGKEPEYVSNLILDFVSCFFTGTGLFGVACGIATIAAAVFFFAGYAVIALVLILLFLPPYTIYCIYKQGQALKERGVMLDIVPAWITYIISGVILFLDPAADMFYYIAALLCLVAIGYTAICTMRRFNEMVTRPIPHFFDRKAGGGK